MPHSLVGRLDQREFGGLDARRARGQEMRVVAFITKPRVIDRFLDHVRPHRNASHIPNKGQVLQRYYSWYASRVRGMRRKTAQAGEEHSIVSVDPEPEALSEAGRRWAELLRRIFEVDPRRATSI